MIENEYKVMNFSRKFGFFYLMFISFGATIAFSVLEVRTLVGLIL